VVQQRREDEFKDVLMNIVRLTRRQWYHLVSEGLLDEESLRGVFPTAGALYLTVMVKMRLKNFRVWTIHESNRLIDPYNYVDALQFAGEACYQLQRKLALADMSFKTIAKPHHIRGLPQRRELNCEPDAE
jgi:hypothetical protein